MTSNVIETKIESGSTPGSNNYSELSYNNLMNCFTGNVTEKALAPLPKNYVASLTEEQLKEIEDIKNSINIHQDDLRFYASNAQAELCNYASGVLSNSITLKMGEAGEALTSALMAINSNGIVDADENIIMRIINSVRRKKETLDIKGKTLLENIVNLQKQLNENANSLDTLSHTFQEMYNGNLVSSANLDRYIYAGELKLQEEISQYETLVAEANANGYDIVENMKLADYKARIDEFARRIDEIKCTKYLTVIQVPETQFIVYNARELASKLRSISQNIAPFLSTQFAIAIGNIRLSESVEKINAVNTGINSLMVSNAHSLESLSPKIINNIEGSLITNETVSEIEKSLVNSLDTSFKLREEAIKMRNTCANNREKAQQTIREAIERNQGTLAFLKEE